MASSIRPRGTGRSGRIPSSSTTARSIGAVTSPRGSSRSCSRQRCARHSNPCGRSALGGGRRVAPAHRSPPDDLASAAYRERHATNEELLMDVQGNAVARYETLAVRQEGFVLFASIEAPPMNLLGTELVRDLVSLIRRAEADDAVRVLVFTSADPDYFISHVDVTRIGEYRQEAAKLTGEPSIAIAFRHLSA